YLMGRRGPAQAAFTNPEIKELGELAGADIKVRPEEVELDPLSRAAVAKSQDRATTKKVEILQGYAIRRPTGKPRTLIVRFLVSPVELIGDASGGEDAPGPERALRHADGCTPAAPDEPVRGAPRRPRLPVRRLPRSAAPGRALQRELGRHPQRQGTGARSRHQAARAGRVRRGLDQAGTDRRHRDQQARRS